MEEGAASNAAALLPRTLLLIAAGVMTIGIARLARLESDELFVLHRASGVQGTRQGSESRAAIALALATWQCCRIEGHSQGAGGHVALLNREAGSPL